MSKFAETAVPAAMRHLLARALAGALIAFGLSATLQAQPAASASSATAAARKSAPEWSALSSTQRSILEPLKDEWPTLDSPRKAKWLEVANRYPNLSAEEKRRTQERMAEWSRMTPAERGRSRMTFQQAKTLPSEERQARWEAYQALPEEERQALVERSQKPQLPSPARLVKPATAGTEEPKSAPLGKAVGPTVVQANPGATTTLMNKQPSPPAHHAPGQPKIAATSGAVDRTTLLPKRGPQATPVQAAAASAGSLQQ